MDAPVETFADGDTEALEDNHADQVEDVEEVVLDETNKNEEHDNEQKAADLGDKKWPGWPGENVFRLLVPAPKVGGIIGRKGEFIKKLCEETRSRIKILENIPGAPERAVMFSAKEEPDVSVPPAMDALLRVHKQVYDGLEAESGHASTNTGTPIVTRLLVAGTQAGSLIGRQGTTIKSIQEGSSCTVRILEDVPACALLDDRVVEIQGDPAGMHKAVELIASQLRKFLVDRSVITLFENSMSAPHPHMEPSMPHQPWGHPQPGPYPGAGGPGFGGNPQYMAPPRQFDNYHPPVDHPHVKKLPSHQGVSAYGRDMPHGHAVPAAAPVQSIITQITQHMQIPLAYADAVIGAAGSSISYIRRASGATITIQETRGIPGEMTVEISGSASQVQTAQQLIQNFMAEAAAPTQNQMNSVDPTYNSYQSHNAYSAPANTGPPGHPSGGYGSVYSGNYGY